MRSSLGLSSLADQSLALDAVRRTLSLLAEANGLLGEPLFKRRCLINTTPT
jgi:hypothetical protein